MFFSGYETAGCQKKKRRKYTIQCKKENILVTKTKHDLNNYKFTIHMGLSCCY